MGSLFAGAPKGPGAPTVTLPPPSAHPPTLGSSAVALAGALDKQKAAAAEGLGMDNTIKTSGEGDLAAPSTAKATLLG